MSVILETATHNKRVDMHIYVLELAFERGSWYLILIESEDLQLLFIPISFVLNAAIVK